MKFSAIVIIKHSYGWQYMLLPVLSGFNFTVISLTSFILVASVEVVAQ